MNSSNPKKQINIEYPEVVHNHKQELLTHMKQPFQVSPKNAEQIIEENKTNEVLREEDNEDELQNKHKLKHLDFSINTNNKNIGFIGKEIDDSPNSKNRSMDSYDLQQIEEGNEDEVKQKHKINKSIYSRKLSQEQQKMQDSLNKIDKEFENLERDSPSRFRKQKSLDVSLSPEEIIVEKEDELVDDETKEKQHKQNILGKTLQKLDKECIPPKDEEALKRRKSVSEVPVDLQQSETIMENEDE